MFKTVRFAVNCGDKGGNERNGNLSEAKSATTARACAALTAVATLVAIAIADVNL